ncbi:peptide ABC transporter substrate-binding protein [Parendozoicomonas haliclonae]|uniref:Periplasmic murein peptide-binding protein n=1 Tax=Parendozoicomonas haliclonae TaxID=1960125 RepID=A0A1X7AF97_9GAMM|nr:peptide ABC transporter substrate-binding protein [Parendozoicomonas haliclonae]SMA37320.1 Periplasmic murein peptide-binding protein precursor [Parendozoicomonas haliclonae]
MKYQSGFKVLGFLVCLITAYAALAGGDPVVRALPGKPVSLDPHKFQSNAEALIDKDLYEGLTVQDEFGNPVPGMAKSWEVSEDGRIWTFHMRDDVVWSDGKPITASDFYYSFQRLANPAIKSPHRFYLDIAGLHNSQAISKGDLDVSHLGVNAADDKTLVITLDHPAHWLPALLTFPAFLPVPEHIISTTESQRGEVWAETVGVAVSNGPYTLEGKEGGEWLLQKNPNYRDAAAVKSEQIIWKEYESITEQVEQFYMGNLHISSALPDHVRALFMADDARQVQSSRTLSTYYLLLNGEDKELSPDVRRALSLALDRNAIFPFGAAGDVAWELIPPWTEGMDANNEVEKLPQYQRDQLALNALKAAGVCEDKPIELKLLSTRSESQWKDSVLVQWARLPGVNVSIEKVEMQDYIRRMNEGDYQLAFGSWIAAYNDPSAFLVLGSRRLSPRALIGIDDGYYDEFVESMWRGGTRFYKDLQERLLLRDTLVPLAHPSNVHLVQPAIQGFVTKNPEGWVHSARLSLQPK